MKIKQAKVFIYIGILIILSLSCFADVSITPSFFAYEETVQGTCNITHGTSNSTILQYRWYVNDILQESGNNSYYTVQNDPNSSNASAYYFNVSYVKPATAVQALWTVKHGITTRPAYNASVLNECFQANDRELTLAMYSSVLCNNAGTSKGVCYNGTDWLTTTTTYVGGSGNCGGSVTNVTNPIDDDWDTYSTYLFAIPPNYWRWATDLGGNSESKWYEESVNWVHGSLQGTEQDLDTFSAYSGLDNVTFSCRAFDGGTYSAWENATTTARLGYMQITFRDIVDNSIITDVDVAYDNWTYSTTNGTLKLYFDVNSTQLNVTADGYEFKQQNIVLSATSMNVYLNPYVRFSILDEIDYTAFAVNETDAITLTIYCANKSTDHSFNVTGNDNDLNESVDCAWTLIRLKFDYPADTYYRSYIPDHSERDIVMYGVDITEQTLLQITLVLNDLTGQYDNGTVIIQKSINGSFETIAASKFDIEGKALLYLIEGDIYTITMQTEEGDERNLGFFVADAAGEKTITLPVIDFVPDSIIGDDISWTWENSTNESIKFYYRDTSGESDIIFTVYNASNTSIILYNHTSYDISSVDYIFPTVVNVTYLACFNATHPDIDEEINECRTYFNGQVMYGPGITDNQKFMNYAGIIFLLIMLLTFGKHAAEGLIAVFLFLVLFITLKWINFGFYINTGLIMFFGVLAFISVIAMVMRK